MSHTPPYTRRYNASYRHIVTVPCVTREHMTTRVHPDGGRPGFLLPTACAPKRPPMETLRFDTHTHLCRKHRNHRNACCQCSRADEIRITFNDKMNPPGIATPPHTIRSRFTGTQLSTEFLSASTNAPAQHENVVWRARVFGSLGMFPSRITEASRSLPSVPSRCQ